MGEQRRETVVVTVRVFVVDDHEVVRTGIRRVLESSDDLEVVGEASTADDAIEGILRTNPDVALLDVRLNDASGVDVCREVRSVNPRLQCIMLTGFSDDEALISSVMAGAAGYALKDISSTDLIDDVRRVARGESLIDPTTLEEAVARLDVALSSAGGLQSLSPQEHRVLDLIGEGRTNREISDVLFLSEKTVKNYVSGLLSKLGMNNRTEAAVFVTKVKGTAQRDERRSVT